MSEEESIASAYCVVYRLVDHAWSVTGPGWSQVHLYRDTNDGSHRLVGWTVETGGVVINVNVGHLCKYKKKSDDFHKLIDEDSEQHGFGFYRKDESIQESKRFAACIAEVIRTSGVNQQSTSSMIPQSSSSSSRLTSTGTGAGNVSPRALQRSAPHFSNQSHPPMNAPPSSPPPQINHAMYNSVMPNRSTTQHQSVSSAFNQMNQSPSSPSISASNQQQNISIHRNTASGGGGSPQLIPQSSNGASTPNSQNNQSNAHGGSNPNTMNAQRRNSLLQQQQRMNQSSAMQNQDGTVRRGPPTMPTRASPDARTNPPVRQISPMNSMSSPAGLSSPFNQSLINQNSSGLPSLDINSSGGHDRRPSVDSPLSGYHSQDNAAMDDYFLHHVPLGKLKILPAKQPKSQPSSMTSSQLNNNSNSSNSKDSKDFQQITVTDPHAVIHTQHVKYDPIRRVYEGLPREWEQHLMKQFGLQPEQLESKRLPEYKSRIPSVLLQMKQHFLQQSGLSTEGVFRIAPDGDESTYQKQKINENRFDGCTDVHIIANLIKVWFRDLPIHLLDSLSTDRVSQVCESEDQSAQLMKSELKEPLLSYLLWLLDLCCDVAANSSINKMTSKNLGIVFGPNLFTASSSDPMSSLMYSQKIAAFLCKLIDWRSKPQNRKLVL